MREFHPSRPSSYVVSTLDLEDRPGEAVASRVLASPRLLVDPDRNDKGFGNASLCGRGHPRGEKRKKKKKKKTRQHSVCLHLSHLPSPRPPSHTSSNRQNERTDACSLHAAVHIHTIDWRFPVQTEQQQRTIPLYQQGKKRPGESLAQKNFFFLFWGREEIFFYRLSRSDRDTSALSRVLLSGPCPSLLVFLLPSNAFF
jgi:hypothetical protein